MVGQLRKLSSTGGVVPACSGPERQHLLSFSRAEILDA